MKNLKVLILTAGLISLSFNLYSADLPNVIEGAETYDKAMCIAQYDDNCVTNICMNSEDIDCQDKCKAAAEEKCKEAME